MDNNIHLDLFIILSLFQNIQIGKWDRYFSLRNIKIFRESASSFYHLAIEYKSLSQSFSPSWL